MSSQMSSSDQKLIFSLPSNTKCVDCSTPQPQWASVTFGTLFCLECSGQHRGLGVHISFVRSLAMDSWSPAQISAMLAGGNKRQTDFFASKGLQHQPGTAGIRGKYCNDVAKLYAKIVKARATGQPEPTELEPNERTPVNAGGGDMSRGDPNGMERLKGESDSEYVQRQTKLKERARERMRAKFGGGGMGGGGGGRMGGVGSDSSYDPSRGGYGGGYSGGMGGGDVMGGLGNAFSSFVNVVGEVGGKVGKGLEDARIGEKLGGFAENAKKGVSDGDFTKVAGSWWDGLAKKANEVAKIITEPDDDDPFSDMKRNVDKGGESKYQGFGSDTVNRGGGSAVKLDVADGAGEEDGWGDDDDDDDIDVSGGQDDGVLVPPAAPAPQMVGTVVPQPVVAAPPAAVQNLVSTLPPARLSEGIKSKPKPVPANMEDFFSSFGA